MHKSLFSLFAVSTLVRASVLPLHRRQSVHEITKWSENTCTDIIENSIYNVSDAAGLECAWFTVPLDYADTSAGSIGLAAVRSRADSTATRKGTVFLSPPNAGDSGFDLFLRSSVADKARMRETLGNDWDLVSFAPRGVLPSGPELWGSFNISLGDFFTFSYAGDLTMDKNSNELLSLASEADELYPSILGDANAANITYIGTTATVRDIAALIDTLDGSDADINFWGFSYGTLVGMELIQLFPNRMGKVILDGVIDPRAWTQQESYLNPALSLADVEEAFKGFIRVCAAAGPDRCALAKSDTETAEQIETRLRAVINEFQGSNFLATQIWEALKSPNDWTEFTSEKLGWVIGADQRATLNSRSWPSRIMPRQNPGRLFAEAFFRYFTSGAVLCGDSVDLDRNTTMETSFREMIRTSKTVSSLFGGEIRQEYLCHLYPRRAVERYSGPWNAKPKNGVLVIGIEADPVTPFRNAKLIASNDFLGSSARLVQQWDFGHTTLKTNSTCTRNTIFNYLNKGELPADKGTDDIDVVCPTNMSLMGNDASIHWDPKTSDVIPQIPAASGAGSLRSRVPIAAMALVGLVSLIAIL